MTTPLTDPLVVTGTPGAETLDVWAVQRCLEALAGADIDTGGLSVAVRFGVATVTFNGLNRFSGFTVSNHGLPRPPVSAFACAAGGALYQGGVQWVNATQINVQAATIDASIPALNTQVSVYWLVIG